MKGLIFTEFLQLVEETHGEDCVDIIIDACDLPHGGAYTAVGNYDHQELVRLVQAFCRETDQPAAAALETFGVHLIGKLRRAFPVYFEEAEGALAFLTGIEDKIHREVRQLYPDAELPQFQIATDGPDRLTLTYRSCRPFAALAAGMIRGAGALFGEDLAIDQHEGSDADGPYTAFAIARSVQVSDPKHISAA